MGRLDIIISWGNNIVLIEVKAFGSFGSKTLESKLARFKTVHEWYERNFGSKETKIDFHLLLLSPQKPEKLTHEASTWLDKTISWQKFDLPKDRLMVSRCDENNKTSESGDFWGIFEAK